MPNPRTPALKAKVTGAAALHPGRHAARSEPRASAFPPAPAHLDKWQKKAWALFAFEMPWLAGSDAALVEVAAIVRAKFLQAELPGVTEISMYQSILSKLGGSPSDRSKVSVPDDETPDDEFFGSN